MSTALRAESSPPREKSVSVATTSENTSKKSEDYEDSRITVSVRVRPLNAREVKATCGSCIAALATYNTLYIFPSSESYQNFDSLVARDPQLRSVAHHRFTFDHVYPTNATQEEIYEQVGRPVLQSSFRGYHTCIFAYGQTGSGKSYCMMGADGGRAIDDSPGIIPRLCREMFDEIAQREAAAAAAAVDGGDQVEFSVYVSYLEIYRERVRSLLDEAADAKVGAAGVPKEPQTPRSTLNSLRRTAATLHASDDADGNLRVREHPTLGVYVEGLAEIPVTSVDQVLKLMVRGNHRRHTASTKMNDTSSRSHAIFTIQLMQRRTHNLPPASPNSQPAAGSSVLIEVAGGEAKPPAIDIAAALAAASSAATTQIGAKINLVDLAGSERAKSTGAEVTTLKEGAQINKSLTTLGIVINALAAQSTSSAASGGGGGGGTAASGRAGSAPAKRHIPYRDSTLTFLLKESLGGNSKTFMIATVSPSTDNYDESVSTLRYADRAKAIMMRAFVNETAGDKRIRELEEEVTRLRERIKALLEAEAERASSTAPDAAPAATSHAMAAATPVTAMTLTTTGASPSLVRTTSLSVSQTPVVLTDSEPLPSPRNSVETAARVNGTPREAGHSHSGATDLDGLDGEGQEEDEGGEGDDDARWKARHGLYAASPPASPKSLLLGDAPEAVVDTLQSELRRAEEMIRQMSITQAEREAHIAKLLAEQERAAAAKAAASASASVAAATSPASVASSPVQKATMRLHRDEPYLLNMDGAGDWVVAHLGPVETHVGVAPHRVATNKGHRDNARAKHSEEQGEAAAAAAVERSLDESYDSSLSLPPLEGKSESATNSSVNSADAAERDSEGESCDPEGSGSTAVVRYVRLPRQFGDGIGSPHCILERSSGSPTGMSSHVTVRGCGALETVVIRQGCSTPFVLTGSTKPLVLQSGDVLEIGEDGIQLKYMDPSAPPLTGRGRRTATPSVLGTGVFPTFQAATEEMEKERAASDPSTSPGRLLSPPSAATGTAVVPALRIPGISPVSLPHTVTTSSAAAHDAEDKAEPLVDEVESNERHDEETDDEEDESEQTSEASASTAASTPVEQPKSAAGLPARPQIPTLALGKAFPTAAGLPRIVATPSAYADPSVDGHGTVTDFATDTTRSTNASTPTLPSSSVSHSLDSKAAALADSAGSPSRSRVAFKSRKPSKRAEAMDAAAGVSSAPRAVLTPSELRAMQDAAASTGTYRSELPARFVGRYNFVLVGPSGGGKTCLVNNLAKPDTPWLQSAFAALTSSARGTARRDSAGGAAVYPTIGVRFKTLTAAGTMPMSLHVHELSGTPCFSPLLDQLPSHRITYLLCFPLHGLTSLMALRGLVEDILCRTDSHTVALVLVGTHADRNEAGEEEAGFLSRLPVGRQEALHRQLEEVEQQVVGLIQMLQPHPQLRPTVVGRFAVDNVHRHVYTTGYHVVETFPQWLQWLADLGRDRCRADADFANGLVPARCLELGRQVSLLRFHGKWCVSLRDFKTLAAAVSSQYKALPAEATRRTSQIGLHGAPTGAAATRDALRSHVQLLADWGVLLHRYRSIQLRQHVILDVVWLSRVLAGLACCPLIAAAAESDGLRQDEAALLVDVVGEIGAMALTRKEAALRRLLTPEAEQVVDMVRVATTDTPHLLRCGVLSMPVLIALLEPHFKTGMGGMSGAARGAAGSDNNSVLALLSLDAVGRRMSPSQPSAAAAERGGSELTRYAVPLAGVVELLVLLDLIIPGRKLFMSPAALSATTLAPATAAEHHGGQNANDKETDDNDDAEEMDVNKESFVLYPLSFRTPAAAGVTWLFPCFLSGPFYVFKLDMVPRNFFPKLLCRLATVADKVYFGPVKKKVWGSATQRWAGSATRSRPSAGNRSTFSPSTSTASVSGPFDAFFEARGSAPFVLPSFEPMLSSTATEDGRPRYRDGFWCDAAWLVFAGAHTEPADGCRVLIRLVHHSVFLSFHCHSVAASLDAGTGLRGHDGRPSAEVQDFYEAVLEAVRYVVEEFPGGKCVESIQCCVDAATLLQTELQHPAAQSDQEAAVLERHLRYANISDNINNLERVLAKSSTALRTARTGRRSHGGPAGYGDGDDGADDESAYVPLLRHFAQLPTLSIHECIRRWKSEQRLYIAPDVEARLTAALHGLEECYHRQSPSDGERDSCAQLDCLLDVLGQVDTA